jgi:hypothetical protein
MSKSIKKQLFMNENTPILRDLLQKTYGVKCNISNSKHDVTGDALTCQYKDIIRGKSRTFTAFVAPNNISETALSDLINGKKRVPRKESGPEMVMEVRKIKSPYDLTCKAENKFVLCHAPYNSFHMYYSPIDRRVSIHQVSYTEKLNHSIRSLLHFLSRKANDFTPASW